MKLLEKRYRIYLKELLKHGVLHLLGFILVLPAYWIRPKSGFLWWFIYDDNMYGYRHEKYWKHYGKEKWWVAYIWLAVRNSHYNKRLADKPEPGPDENVVVYENRYDFTPPEGKDVKQLGMEFRNFEKPGKQFAEYSRNGKLYFRWSEAGEVYYLFGFIKLYRSMMFGYSNKRTVSKVRHRTIKEHKRLLSIS
tara:strand:- start:1142 stop:1720 length:579 start_codon:yes stop_codon:yes gene_type:complete